MHIKFGLGKLIFVQSKRSSRLEVQREYPDSYKEPAVVGIVPGPSARFILFPHILSSWWREAALRTAISEGIQEPRIPYIRSFDVLIQYLMTLSVSDGFDPDQIFEEIKQTHCYHSMDEDEWLWILSFLLHGGKSLRAYDEYQKVVVKEGKYLVANQYIARRHKLSIGTIVGDVSLQVRFYWWSTNWKYRGRIYLSIETR